MKMSYVRAAALLAVMVLSSRAAHAIAPVCIHTGDSAGLAQALANAATTGTNTVIEVEQGTYVVPPTGWLFQFSPRQDVSLLGGYVPGTSCQQRHITASPTTPTTNTVLDGQSKNGAAITLGLLPANPGSFPYGTLTIEGFEMRNLLTTQAGSSALFATYEVGDGDTGGIVFRYNWVHDSVAAAAVIDLHTGGAMTFTNNLVDKNIGSKAVNLLSAVFNSAPWRLVNNTVANNTGEGLVVDESGTYAQMFNNILYANTSFDLEASGAFVELHGDTYGTSTTTSGGNISNHGYVFPGVNPGYDSTTFHLTAGSGSINSGAGFAGVLPAQDLDGNVRWGGSSPDRGAFEANNSDQAYWVVTSAGDGTHALDSSVSCNPGSPTCTLREAIVRANVAGASRIAFTLGASCPHVIVLNSPLPNVNVPLQIDGFSQAGSAANTTPLDRNASLTETLCIVVEGAPASAVASGLVVGATDFGAQLEVRGVTFEGFTGPAISIAQGSYHWIHGSSFGIETNSNPFVFSNGAGVLFGSGVTFSTIGGPAPGDVNLFGKMNDAAKSAIQVNAAPNGHFGNVIAENLVGYAPGFGLVANAGTGIVLQNAGYNELFANTIVASAKDGVDISGATANANWLHDNYIGSAPLYGFNYVNTFSNGGTGIAILNGAAGNHIGGFDDTAGQAKYGNGILNNKGPGVWIKTGAGAGNTVLSNAIGANGPSSGGDLAIDYGPLGSSDGGGVATITLSQGGYFLSYFDTFALHFIATGTGGSDYRVDFYTDNITSCDESGYGPAEKPVQTFFFTMPGSGTTTTGFDVVLPVPTFSQSPTFMTAAVTDRGTHTTSQISNCATLTDDQLFYNGFESTNVAF